jgi:hypothetical protein
LREDRDDGCVAAVLVVVVAAAVEVAVAVVVGMARKGADYYCS